MMEVLVTTAAIKRQIVTIHKPKPSFLQAGCPSCHPTNSVKSAEGKKYHLQRRGKAEDEWSNSSRVSPSLRSHGLM